MTDLGAGVCTPISAPGRLGGWEGVPPLGEGPATNRQGGGEVSQSRNWTVTPLGNTGGNSPKAGEDSQMRSEKPAEVGLGWLKLRLTKSAWEALEMVFVRVGLWGPGKPVAASQQHRQWGWMWWWGAKVYWGMPSPDVTDQGEVEWHMERSAAERAAMRAAGVRVGEVAAESAMLELGDEALRVFIEACRREGLSFVGILGDWLGEGSTVTRLDLSADFEGVSIEPVCAAELAGDYGPMRVSRTVDSRREGPGGGRTCYFGRRGKAGGGVYVRFYEKGAQLCLPYDVLRFEVELSGERAQDAAWRIVSEGDVYAGVAASILAGVIDFRAGFGAERGGAHAARDTERHGWWGRLLALLAPAVKLHRSKRVPATIDSIREWVENTWRRPLALLAEFYGDAWASELFRRLLEEGRGLLGEAELAMVRHAKLPETWK